MRYNWVVVALGVLVLFLGWYNFFTGIFALVLGSPPLTVIVDLENMTTQIVDQTTSFYTLMILRVILGFIFIVLGNEFLHYGLNKHKVAMYCRPCGHDMIPRKVRRV